MNFKIKILFLAVAAVLLCPGCASPRPVLYPNAFFNKVGKVKAERDVDQVLETAGKYGLRSTSHADDATDTTTDTGVGAATGAAMGGVAGATGTSVGVGAAAGAAGGAAAGGTRIFFRWLFGTSQPSQAYRGFVERTLREKGYDVIGWE